MGLAGWQRKIFRGFCLIFAHNSFGINKTLSKPRTKKNQKEPKRTKLTAFPAHFCR